MLLTFSSVSLSATGPQFTQGPCSVGKELATRKEVSATAKILMFIIQLKFLIHAVDFLLSEPVCHRATVHTGPLLCGKELATRKKVSATAKILMFIIPIDI